ncbi:MAG TPA: endopeptidase La, partial [Desulfobulbaceae bacterium]|nr:endopeptidase La [Desulfobulbaceae bacterium]
MSELTPEIYPLMPLRDIVLFPGMVAPLVVGRKKSIRALESAMESRTLIFLVTQKESAVDDPEPEHLYKIGTLASVMQLLRLPDGTIKALVEGKRRAKMTSIYKGSDFFSIEVEELPDIDRQSEDVAAYVRELKRAFEQYARMNKKLPKEVLKSVNAVEDPSRLVDLICSH